MAREEEGIQYALNNRQRGRAMVWMWVDTDGEGGRRQCAATTLPRVEFGEHQLYVFSVAARVSGESQ